MATQPAQTEATKLAKAYGPWALVTGASEGIGRSFAEQLANAGLNVVLVARRTEALTQLAHSLEAEHDVLCAVITADLSVPDDVRLVLDKTQHLDLGLLVCNAGFGTAGHFLAGDVATEMNMLAVNCAAVTQMTFELGRRFKARGRGGVVLLSSIVAGQGVASSAHYAATKAYVHTLGEGLQVEWQGSGLDLLIVAPGPVQTGFAARSGMRMAQSSTPAVVARQALQALGRKNLIHPGALAKLMASSLATAPRWLRVRVMSKIMHGMTAHLA